MINISKKKFDAESSLNNEMSFDDFQEYLHQQQEYFDDVDDYEFEEYSSDDDTDFDDKEARRELLAQQDGERHRDRRWENQVRNLEILRQLKLGYKQSRVAFSNHMIQERVLTRAKYPTITLHFLELFPRLSRVPMVMLQDFQKDFSKGFNSGLSTRILARPDRSSSDPSNKNMQLFHKWLSTVNLEEISLEQIQPKRLSVFKTRRRRVPHKNNHIVISEENGSHGEVTEGDDLAMAWDSSAFGNTMVSSVFEGFSSVKHKKKTGEPPKRSKLAKPCKHFAATGQCKYGEDCKFTHQEPVDSSSCDSTTLDPPVDPTPILYVTDTHIAWDGQHVYLDGYSSQGIKAAAVLPVGTEVEGVGCNWFVTVNPLSPQRGSKIYKLTDPIQHFQITSQYYLGSWVSGFSGPVFCPAIERIVQTIPCLGVLDKAKSATALALISRFYPGLPDNLVESTHKYWALRNLTFKRNTLDSTDTARILGQTRVEFLQSIYNTQIMSQVYRENGICYNTINQISVPAVVCDVLAPSVFKENFSFTAKGVSWDPTGPQPYPRFNTPSTHYRWYTTQMCRFEGFNGSFVVYDNTPENMSLAMKRLFAARPDEQLLYANQLWLTMQLCYRSRPSSDVANLALQPGFVKQAYMDERVLVWCRCTPNYLGRPLTYNSLGNMPSNAVIGKGKDSHTVSFTNYMHGQADYPDHVLDALMRPCSRTSRSHLDQIYDAILNKATITYYRVYQAFTEYLDAHGARELSGTIDHVKRRLRQRYVNGVLLHLDEDCMVKTLLACVKREYAKPGKVPRLFIDYNSGSMYANELPEWVKECINGAYHFTFNSLAVRIYIFAKPKASILQEELEHLIRHTTHSDDNYNVLLFSDDSVHTGCFKNVSFAYNVDISSTDSSNCTFAFSMIASCLSKFNSTRARGLVEQCCKAILLLNPCEPKERITVQFHGPFEGSGTVLTTILNHLASYAGSIMTAYFMSLESGHHGVQSFEFFAQRGYAAVGHQITCECCGTPGVVVPEKIQFLKRSPIWSGKNWIPTLNLGCIFRGFGTLDNDLRPEQLGCLTLEEFKNIPWEDRMDLFLSSIVRGLVHEPPSTVIKALRDRFNVGLHTTISPNYLNTIPEFNDFTSEIDVAIFDESLSRRYDLSVSDLHELAHHICDIKLGGVSVTKAITDIYRVDYGLSSSSKPPEVDVVYPYRGTLAPCMTTGW